MANGYEDIDEDELVGWSDEGDYLPTQEQAIALDRQLSQQVPQPNFDSGAQFGPVQISGPIGNATREYLTGRPGLFVQGGPSVPEGQIMVNGVLERSQAAPQPVPWWITQADEFREERRREDFLRGLTANSPGAVGNQAIERALQLEGILGFDADRKAGVPVQEALMRHAPKMYFKSPASVARLEVGLRPRVTAAATPFTPTVTDVGGQQLFQISPNRYQMAPRPAATKPISLGPEGQLRALELQLRDIQKQEEQASFSRDKTALGTLRAERNRILSNIQKLSGGQQAQAEAPTQTQTSPRVALANKLSTEHPDWTKEQIISEVRKQLK